MVSLNRIWWEHLAPKAMHKRRREVETQLRQWCSTEYGKFWLDTARKESGVIRCKPGDIIPNFTLIALGDQPAYIAPKIKVRHGHRAVGPDEFQSGTSLSEGELPFQPTIRLDLAIDPMLLESARTTARTGKAVKHVPGVKQPSTVLSVPANFLLSPKNWPKKAYVLYQHIFGEGTSYPDDGYFYVGVTTRSWQMRWNEHRRAIQAGSPLLFHRKFREEMEAERITYIHHKVMGITDNIEQLYDTEEYLVEGHWKDTRRLNMIPGGKSGIKYLRENGLLAQNIVPLPDERDRIVATWLKDNPRRGLPAPWVAEKWKDDDWAIAQICGRENRLSPEQVKAIRKLAATHSAEIIAERIGALNAQQVQRVIDGKTYTRIS